MSKAKANRKTSSTPNVVNLNETTVTHGEVVANYVEHGTPQEVAEMIADDVMADQAKILETEVTPPNKEEVEGATVTAEELILKYGNKSNAIRALSAEGKTRSEVAKLLGIRYQHVNNVLGQVLKRVIKKERDEAAAAAAATGAEAK